MRFIWIVAVGLIAGCGLDDLLTGGGGPSCTEQVETHLDVSATTPQLHLTIESCRVDVDACPGLCTTAMSASQIVGSFQKCSVTFDGSTAHLDVTYQVENNNTNCAVPSPDLSNAGA